MQLRAAASNVRPMRSCASAIWSIPQRRIMRPMSLLRTSSREGNNAIGTSYVLFDMIGRPNLSGLALAQKCRCGLLQTRSDRDECRRFVHDVHPQTRHHLDQILREAGRERGCKYVKITVVAEHVK